MFLGQYHHNLDEKGRLTIPVRFRDLLLAEGGYVLQGFDKNLMVLPSAYFELLSHSINHKSVTDPIARMLRRMIYSTANRVEVDKVGRILIPQFLRQFAELEGDVVVVGNGQYFEIWSKDHWSALNELLCDSETMAQRFVGLDLASE